MDEDAGGAPSPKNLEGPPADDREKADDPLFERDRKIEELTQTLKRVQAEFDNYKKRAAKEWAEKAKFASESIVLEILPIIDTLDTAIGKVGEETRDGDGLAGIRKQLLQALQRQGLREVRTDGKFDPFEHEALQRVEDEDGEDGDILEVYQKGYMLGPKVIRTAKVKVAVNLPRAGDAEDDIQNDDNHAYADEEER